MPYKVEKRGEKFALIKKDDGTVLGMHDTEEAAMGQMKAIGMRMHESHRVTAFLNDPKQVSELKKVLEQAHTYHTDRMQRCLGHLEEKGFDAGSAHAICYATIGEGANESKKPRAFYFSELADLRESEIDAAQFIAKGVTLIRPGFSSNMDKAGRSRYYSRATLEAAKTVFEGTRAFLNHPRRTDSKELPERDVRDIAGYYTNIRAADDGRLLADFHIVGQARETTWPLIVEAVKNKPDLIELSINALGTTRLGEAEGRQAIVVESIVGANSVDLVTTGAMGGSLAGALLHSDPDEWTGALLAAMPFEQWRESRPDFLEKLKKEWITIRDSEVLKESKATIAKLEAEISRLKEELQTVTADRDKHQRASLADSILESSGLPVRIQKAIRAELLEKATEAEMKAFVQGEQAKYRTAPKPPVPVNESGTRTQDRPAYSSPTVTHPLLESEFGIRDRSKTPRDGESPEQWAKRIGKTN